MLPFFLYFRSECPLLPIPGFYHLPQLAASKTTNVLAGPKPALCKERGRHNGEYEHTKKKTNINLLGFAVPHFMMVSMLLSPGIRCELSRHHLGENLESL